MDDIKLHSPEYNSRHMANAGFRGLLCSQFFGSFGHGGLRRDLNPALVMPATVRCNYKR